MIKDYSSLSGKDENVLAKAWNNIHKALDVYERVTGASDLDDVINECIWAEIEQQKAAEE